MRFACIYSSATLGQRCAFCSQGALLPWGDSGEAPCRECLLHQSTRDGVHTAGSLQVKLQTRPCRGSQQLPLADAGPSACFSLASLGAWVTVLSFLGCLLPGPGAQPQGLTHHGLFPSLWPIMSPSDTSTGMELAALLQILTQLLALVR